MNYPNQSADLMVIKTTHDYFKIMELMVIINLHDCFEIMEFTHDYFEIMGSMVIKNLHDCFEIMEFTHDCFKTMVYNSNYSNYYFIPKYYFLHFDKDHVINFIIN